MECHNKWNHQSTRILQCPLKRTDLETEKDSHRCQGRGPKRGRRSNSKTTKHLRPKKRKNEKTKSLNNQPINLLRCRPSPSKSRSPSSNKWPSSSHRLESTRSPSSWLTVTSSARSRMATWSPSGTWCRSLRPWQGTMTTSKTVERCSSRRAKRLSASTM